MSEAYRIELERSGGFAGLTLRTTADSRELPADEAGELERLLERADLEGLAARPRREPAGADRFQYDLTVERGGRRLQVTLGEADVPPALRPLLDRLLARARRP